MITIRNLATAEVQLVSSADGIDPEAWEVLAVPEPSGAMVNGGLRFVDGEWRAAPRMLTGLQILGLYTAPQHARARRMLNTVFPDGHAQAGQLVDPDALVQRLVDATLALPRLISATDPLHINGTALMRATGVIETDAEAARIAAGIPPTT